MRLSLRTMGTRELAKRIRKLSKEADDELLAGYKEAALLVVREAKKNTDIQFYQAGRPWKKRGTLKRSIKEDVRKQGAGVRAAVGSGLIYARIHEYGGQAGRGHAVTIPERQYLRPALEAKNREIFELVATRFEKLLRKVL